MPLNISHFFFISNILNIPIELVENMQLTTFSDYSMRVMMYLGLRQGKLATISEIALAYHISENHLTKVVHHLAKLGYVETVRGKGGGLRLVLLPEAVNIGKMLRDSEGSSSLLPCLIKEDECCIQRSCQLIGILREAQDALFAVLDKYTLADLLFKDTPLARILLHPKSMRVTPT
ncbi:HTH-type transcriptional repressor NsrR [mine drainage metagenome]|uniref:HTH-type transcriptional repressor NsrR n=1 Tax=mine drainage metagenome TaxID=410659 RepID=A0A1J5RRI6_9ZZZZ